MFLQQGCSVPQKQPPWGSVTYPAARPVSQKSWSYNLIHSGTRCSVCSFVQRVSERALLARVSRRWQVVSIRVLGGFPESRPEKKAAEWEWNKYLSSAPRCRNTWFIAANTFCWVPLAVQLPGYFELCFVIVSSLISDNRGECGEGDMLWCLLALRLKQNEHKARRPALESWVKGPPHTAEGLKRNYTVCRFKVLHLCCFLEKFWIHPICLPPKEHFHLKEQRRKVRLLMRWSILGIPSVWLQTRKPD